MAKLFATNIFSLNKQSQHPSYTCKCYGERGTFIIIIVILVLLRLTYVQMKKTESLSLEKDSCSKLNNDCLLRKVLDGCFVFFANAKRQRRFM